MFTEGTKNMTQAGIKIENVHLSFGQTEVLKGVNLDIKPGEFFAFLGPSGSGKSTLLRAIAGFGPNPKGRILIGGRDMVGLDPWVRNVGMVFQSYALLDGGVIQQVGTPQELYDQPSNLFVANFLGTANILEGHVETNGNQARFVTKTGDNLSLPQGGTGTNIVLRPQNISIQQQSSANAMRGKILHREFLGSQVRYLIDAGGAELVVDQTHGGGEWFGTGSEVYLSANTSNAVVI